MWQDLKTTLREAGGKKTVSSGSKGGEIEQITCRYANTLVEILEKKARNSREETLFEHAKMFVAFAEEYKERTGNYSGLFENTSRNGFVDTLEKSTGYFERIEQWVNDKRMNSKTIGSFNAFVESNYSGGKWAQENDAEFFDRVRKIDPLIDRETSNALYHFGTNQNQVFMQYALRLNYGSQEGMWGLTDYFSRVNTAMGYVESTMPQYKKDAQNYDVRAENLRLFAKEAYLRNTWDALKNVKSGDVRNAIFTNMNGFSEGGRIAYFENAVPSVLRYDNAEFVGTMLRVVNATAARYRLDNAPYPAENERRYMGTVSSRMERALRYELQKMIDTMKAAPGIEEDMRILPQAQFLADRANLIAIRAGEIGMPQPDAGPVSRATGMLQSNNAIGIVPNAVSFFNPTSFPILPDRRGAQKKFWELPSKDAILNELARYSPLGIIPATVMDRVEGSTGLSGVTSITANNTRTYREDVQATVSSFGPVGRVEVGATSNIATGSPRHETFGALIRDLNNKDNWSIRNLQYTESFRENDKGRTVSEKVSAALDYYSADGGILPAGIDNRADVLTFYNRNEDGTYDSKTYVRKELESGKEVWMRYFAQKVDANAISVKYGRIFGENYDVRERFEANKMAGFVVGGNSEKIGLAMLGKNRVSGTTFDKTDDMAAGMYFRNDKTGGVPEGVTYVKLFQVEEAGSGAFSFVSQPVEIAASGGDNERSIDFAWRKEDTYISGTYFNYLRGMAGEAKGGGGAIEKKWENSAGFLVYNQLAQGTSGYKDMAGAIEFKDEDGKQLWRVQPTYREEKGRLSTQRDRANEVASMISDLTRQIEGIDANGANRPEQLGRKLELQRRREELVKENGPLLSYFRDNNLATLKVAIRDGFVMEYVSDDAEKQRKQLLGATVTIDNVALKGGMMNRDWKKFEGLMGGARVTVNDIIGRIEGARYMADELHGSSFAGGRYNAKTGKGWIVEGTDVKGVSREGRETAIKGVGGIGFQATPNKEYFVLMKYNEQNGRTEATITDDKTYVVGAGVTVLSVKEDGSVVRYNVSALGEQSSGTAVKIEDLARTSTKISKVMLSTGAAGERWMFGLGVGREEGAISTPTNQHGYYRSWFVKGNFSVMFDLFGTSASGREQGIGAGVRR